MSTRQDVSAVPPQGGYVARRCPVRAQWDTVRPCEPLPPSPALGRRLARGVEFERHVAGRLVALHPDGRVIAGTGSGAGREAATARAMADGVALIVGGRLPADLERRRVGEPDLLVAAAGGGYRPVDIKHHRCVDRGTGRDASHAAGQADAGGGLPARCSALGGPALEAAELDPVCRARRRREDLLQLAHYQRMLEAAGFAPAGGRHAGIIGTEEVVTWYDLDAPTWLTPSSGAGRKRRTTMEVYDFEFDFRLDVIAVADRHLADPRVTPLVVPVRIGECGECPWWAWCGPALRAGPGDVSLLPRVSWREWRVHRDHHVTDRAALASLDHRTATLVADQVDLRPVLAARGRLPDETEIDELVARPAQRARLAAGGVTTLGDARTLCARTASYCDEPMRALPEQIDLARAALGGAPAYRRRGVNRVEVPRGDVEADIDMESAESGVYLWGALVTDRTDRAVVPSGYHAFATWHPLTSEGEASLFAEFWEWLGGLRRTAHAGGLRFRAYCYNAAAESSQMRRIALAAGVRVEEFLGSREWVDLLQVFSSQIITGTSAGLKDVAPLAGFSWEVADPGGGESMVRYDAAAAEDGDNVPDASREAREWLLAYNRGDVEATFALREWLDHAASACPPVGELGS